MQISPFLIILLLWLCVGLPISRINQAKKKNAGQRMNAGRPAAPAAAPIQKTQQASAAPETPGPLARETRLMPTVSVTPNDDSVYAGSMNVITGEGMDPCHEEDLAGLNSAEAAPVRPVSETHALPFGWTGSDMVRGIVVSEILNRRK